MTFNNNDFDNELFISNILTDPFESFLLSYFEHIQVLDNPDEIDKEIRLVARSSDSSAAYTLMAHSDEIHALNINIKTVFTKLENPKSMENWINKICKSDINHINNSLRWAKKNALQDAHEQFILGSTMCWSGDSMRRLPESRNITNIFEYDVPNTVKIAKQSFNALWNASSSITKQHIKRLSIVECETTIDTTKLDYKLEDWGSNFHHIISTRH